VKAALFLATFTCLGCKFQCRYSTLCSRFNCGVRLDGLLGNLTASSGRSRTFNTKGTNRITHLYCEWIRRRNSIFDYPGTIEHLNIDPLPGTLVTPYDTVHVRPRCAPQERSSTNSTSCLNNALYLSNSFRQTEDRLCEYRRAHLSTHRY
jgi:hypothetical protein